MQYMGVFDTLLKTSAPDKLPTNQFYPLKKLINIDVEKGVSPVSCRLPYPLLSIQLFE